MAKRITNTNQEPVRQALNRYYLDGHKQVKVASDLNISESLLSVFKYGQNISDDTVHDISEYLKNEGYE